MQISYDPSKREATLIGRGIDFDDAKEIFSGPTLDYPDERKNYGEVRIITVGRLRGRMVIVIWTPRGKIRHVISMRKANDREQIRFGQRLSEN